MPLSFADLSDAWTPYENQSGLPREDTRLWGEGGCGVWISSEWGPPIPYFAADRPDGNKNHGYRCVKGNLQAIAAIPEVIGWPEFHALLDSINRHDSPIESVGCEKNLTKSKHDSTPPWVLGSYTDIVFSQADLNDEPKNLLKLVSIVAAPILKCEDWWGDVSFVLQRYRFIAGAQEPWGLSVFAKGYGHTDDEARRTWGASMLLLTKIFGGLSDADFRMVSLEE